MDIGTIVAGLQAIGQLFGANRSPRLTPAQAEEEKPKKAQPINAFIVLPNQTPPMGLGVPLVEPLPSLPLQPSLSEMAVPRSTLRRMLRKLFVEPIQQDEAPLFVHPIYHGEPPTMVHPVYDGAPPTMVHPIYRGVSPPPMVRPPMLHPLLRELYSLYFGLR